jgi:hypothetical protein
MLSTNIYRRDIIDYICKLYFSVQYETDKVLVFGKPTATFQVRESKEWEPMVYNITTASAWSHLNWNN